MKPYTFLMESRNKFVKRLMRYTPQEREKIRRVLISNGRHGLNKNGAYMKGMYTADEYGKRAFEGQKTRLRKIAKQNGISDFKIKDRVNNDVLRGEVFGNNEVSLPSITNPLSPKFKAKLDSNAYHGIKHAATKNPKTANPEVIKQKGKIDSTYFKRARKSVTKPNDNVSVPLTGYTVANHEADELASALKLSKKTGLSVDDAVNFFRDTQIKNLGTHNPGVLERERKLYKDLSTMYGRNSFFRIPRSKVEVRANRNI